MRRFLFAVSALALCAVGCGIPEEKYNSTLNELTKAKADLDARSKAASECSDKLAAADKENIDLKGRLKSMGADVNQKASDLEAMKKRNEELRKAQEQAELRSKQFRDLVAKFKSMMDSGKLKVEIRNGLMLVKLADNILFDPGRTDLKKEGKDAIKEVSHILAGIEGRKFQVAGHTDNQGLAKGSKYKTNWELSTARAVEVVHFMIREGGMQPDRLSAAGFADQLPVAKNDTEDGKKQNRRIEIVLLPNIEDLPPMDEAK